MELYHVLNRGVEKRTIFLDSQDRARFVHDMYEFNDEKPAWNLGRELATNPYPMIDLRNQSSERKQIVDIHGWCLMKNHYHLLITERIEGGLTKFIRKLNIGYANYFNEKYKRVGSLFQGRTKRIHVNSDAFFLHILNYVHFNPLDYYADARHWRERAVANPRSAHAYLMKYRWNSYLDYCGEKNFPSILSTALFGENPAKFKKHILEYSGSSHTILPKPFQLE